MDQQKARLNEPSPNNSVDRRKNVSGERQSNDDDDPNESPNQVDINRYITDDENSGGPNANLQSRANRLPNNLSNGPITSAQPMSSLQDTIGNDEEVGRNNGNLPVLLNTVSNVQARSDDYLIDLAPQVMSPQNTQVQALNEANAIAKRLSNNITQAGGKQGVAKSRGGGYSILQDNMYLGHNLQDVRGKAHHRRNVTELFPIISSKPASRINEQSGHMLNNSTVSSLHKEFLMRNQPNRRPAHKNQSILNNSINVGGGRVYDIFVPQRAFDLTVNNSTAKVGKQSIDDMAMGGAYDRRSRIGRDSGQQLMQSLKKQKLYEGKVPFVVNNQQATRTKVKSTIGNVNFVASNMVANNIGNLNIKLKNDSQLLKQTQSLFKSPPLHHDKARQRYDSSSSSGKLAVYITDSQTTTKKPNVQVNPVRYSSLRATSGHRNNCTTHSLVSAKHRSSKLKWKEFEHNCNNMRIIESNKKIHESRILSGHHATHNASKLRKQLVNQVGYGQITGGETDSMVQDLLTDRSGGRGKDLPTGRSGGAKDQPTARSGGRDPLNTSRSAGKNSNGSQYKQMLDNRLITTQALITTDTKNLKETVINKMLSQNQITPYGSDKAAIKALKNGTPPPLDLRKIGTIKDDRIQDSIVFDQNTENLTDRSRSNHRKPIIPQELRSGIWISGDYHNNQKQAPYIHSNINTISMNGSQEFIDGPQKVGLENNLDMTPDESSQGQVNRADQARKQSQVMNSLSSKSPNVFRNSNVNEEVTHDETRQDNQIIFSDTARGDQNVFSANAGTSNYHAKGRHHSIVNPIYDNRGQIAPQTAAIFSSTFQIDKRTSIADFHCQREEILSGRYKGSDLPNVKNQMLKMQLRQNMTGYETRRKGPGKAFKSPISIDEGARMEGLEPANVPILGIMDSKRGSHFPKRSSQQQNIDFSYPQKTIKELKESSVSPENIWRKQMASAGTAHALVGKGGRLIYNLNKIQQQQQKKGQYKMKDSIWLPNPEKFLASKINQSIMLRNQDLSLSSKGQSKLISASVQLESMNQIIPKNEKAEEGILRQQMADPVLQPRPSTLKEMARRNDSSVLFLPDINQGQIPERIHQASQDISVSESALKRDPSPIISRQDQSPQYHTPAQRVQQKQPMKRVSHPSYPNQLSKPLQHRREEPTLVNAPASPPLPAKQEVAQPSEPPKEERVSPAEKAPEQVQKPREESQKQIEQPSNEPPKRDYQIPESPKESEKKEEEPQQIQEDAQEMEKRESIPNLEQVQAAWEKELQGDVAKPSGPAKMKTPSPQPDTAPVTTPSRQPAPVTTNLTTQPTTKEPLKTPSITVQPSQPKSEQKSPLPEQKSPIQEKPAIPEAPEKSSQVRTEKSEQKKSELQEQEPAPDQDDLQIEKKESSIRSLMGKGQVDIPEAKEEQIVEQQQPKVEDTQVKDDKSAGVIKRSSQVSRGDIQEKKSSQPVREAETLQQDTTSKRKESQQVSQDDPKPPSALQPQKSVIKSEKQDQASQRRASQTSSIKQPDSQKSSQRRSQMKVESVKTPTVEEQIRQAETPARTQKSARRRPAEAEKNEAKDSEPLNIEIKGAMMQKKTKGKASQKLKTKDAIADQSKPKKVQSRQEIAPSKLSQKTSNKEDKSAKTKSKQEDKEEPVEKIESAKVTSALKRSDQGSIRGKSKSSVRIQLDERDSKKKKLELSGPIDTLEAENNIDQDRPISEKSNQIKQWSDKSSNDPAQFDDLKNKAEKADDVEKLEKIDKKVSKAKKSEEVLQKVKLSTDVKSKKGEDKKTDKKTESKKSSDKKAEGASQEVKRDKSQKQEKASSKSKGDAKSKKKEEAASKSKAAKSSNVSRKSRSQDSDEAMNKSIVTDTKLDKVKSAMSVAKKDQKSEKKSKEKSAAKKSEKSEKKSQASAEKSGKKLDKKESKKSVGKKSEKSEKKGASKTKKDVKAVLEKGVKELAQKAAKGAKGAKSILKKKGGAKASKVPSVQSDAPLSASLSQSSKKGDSSKSDSKKRGRKLSQETVEEQEVAPNAYWDTGTDPIDFFSTRVLFDRNRGDSLDSEMKRPTAVKTKDWAKSRCFKLVMELRILPRQDRVQNARILEQIYLNPREIDIFTEDEAAYNTHILKQRYQTQHLNGIPNTDHEFYLYEIDQKARRTMQVLSSFMLLSKHAHKDILDLLRDENLFMATLEEEIQPGILSHYKDSIGIMTPTVQALHGEYKAPTETQDAVDHNPLPLAVTDINRSPLKRSFEKMRIDVDHNNVIKLLIRVRNLYQTLNEIVQILELIVQQREMFTNPESLLNQMMIDFLERDIKPSNLQKKSGDSTPERILVKGQQVLQRLSRRISHFLSDHKVYKSFIFLGMNYQQVLFKYSKLLAKLLRLHLSNKKQTQYAQFQNPSYNYDGGVIEFGPDKTNLEFTEPIEEQVALFKKVQYFTEDTVFLPFLNPEYGDGKYDGRFNNQEFFRNKINMKMKNFLQKKMQDEAQSPSVEQRQSQLKQSLLPPVKSPESMQKNAPNVKGNVDMFNIDYEAGSNAAILSSYVGGQGQSQNLDLQGQSLHNLQRARIYSRDVERQPQKRQRDDPSERFEDAFNEFNAHYEASMIDHQTFKDSQSRVQTVGTVIPFSGKIVSSSGDGVLSDDRMTVSARKGAIHKKSLKKPIHIKKKDLGQLEAEAQRLDQQIAQMQQDGSQNKVAFVEINSASQDDTQTMRAGQFQSATYAVPVHYQMKAGGYILSPNRVEVRQAPESQQSQGQVSGSQITADLGHKMGTQGINVGVKGRKKPEKDSAEHISSAGKNIFSAGSLHKMNSNQMLDLQQEMQNALGSQIDQEEARILSSKQEVNSGEDIKAAGQSIQSNFDDREAPECGDDPPRRPSLAHAGAIVDELEGNLSQQMAIQSQSSGGQTVKVKKK